MKLRDEDRIIICHAHRKKDGKPCTRLARKGENFCWQHSSKFWRNFRRLATIIGGILGSIAAGIILYTTVIKNLYDVNSIIFPSATFTSTQTPSQIPTTTSTFTSTPIPTPTPKEHGIYYMIVLDASLKMTETFDGKTKWDAALEAVHATLEGREEEANYGLVVVGGSTPKKGENPCDEPSALALPFSSRETVTDNIKQLRPSGGGSIYTAFNLAKDQFRSLPENTIHTLVFITGSSDACESRDEWKDLERSFNFPGGIGVELYSEIIVLEQNELISRTIEEQFESLSTKLNVQSPTSFVMLNQTNNNVINNVINNVSNYVETTIASFPTSAPMPTSTNILTKTPDVVITTKPPSVVVTTIAPSFTSTITQTNTATPLPTDTLIPTIPPVITPTPFVELLSYNYLQSGIGCQVDITVRVSGSAATGSFHVWNANYPPEGDIYAPTTLQLGTYNNNLVTLGGLTPEFYWHEVWFEYNGISSNRLTSLICPGLTPSP